MSMNTEIYQDISTRTAGDIYIGVVGPVRAVLPDAERAVGLRCEG